MARPMSGPGYTMYMNENKMGVKICYDEKVYNFSNWTPDPWLTSVPTLYTEMAFQLALSAIIFLLLLPLNQSRLVAEIIAGIMVGPSLLGSFPGFLYHVFPFTSDTVLRLTMSLGVVYYVFQLGLQMNLTHVVKIGRETTTTAILGMILPLSVGIGSYFLMIPPLKHGESVLHKLRSAFVWATALNATNLPELARVLADEKLMRTDIGRTAAALSYVNDIAMWSFLTIVISVFKPGDALRVCTATVVFILFSMFVARPVLSWLISYISKGQEYKESHVQYILIGVLVSGFITDALGIGSLLGAFFFGFILPSGQLATLVLERIEKITLWIMLPLYCIMNGIKTHMNWMIPHGRSVWHVILFMAISWAAKVVSTFLVSFKPGKTRPHEVFILGVLMNSKGVLALFTINIGREYYLFDIESTTVMVLTILLIMMSVPPIVKYTYRPQKRMMLHKVRTIESSGSQSSFRILTCIHSKHQVPGIKSLLEMSNPTTMSKIYVFGVRLVELTEYASAAMLLVHDAYHSNHSGQRTTKTNPDPIIQAMHELERENKPLIFVECLTAVSRYTTMHIDICSIAEDKQAAFIIIPFHMKDNTVEENEKDEKEDVDPTSIRNMNQQLLSNAPCTVGLLVDRGLGEPKPNVCCLIMFYIGGADDREALTYAWRMVWRPNVHLTVVRLVPGTSAIDSTRFEDPDESVQGILNLLEDSARQKELDEEFINEFKDKTMKSNVVSFFEVPVNGGEDTIEVIKSFMENNRYELCMIGKGDRRISPVESGLKDLVEFQELGAIGDSIVASNFSTSTSVLVIQRYHASPQQKQKESSM